MKRIVFLLTLIFPSIAQSAELQYLHGLRDTSYERVEASEIGRWFHVYTMLPESYSDDPARHYPTIYVLDGGTLMPLLAAYYRYLRFTDETEEAIIVGISYGAVSFEDGNFRSTDFTAPSPERDYWGGAEMFQAFLEEKLLPRIESMHRSDPERRVLFGHSLAGQFVLYSAQSKPSLFWGHIASNPALHRNLEYFLQTRPDSKSAGSVFVAGGSDDADVYKGPRQNWVAHWSRVEPKPWRLKTAIMNGHTHTSLPPAAFRQGLAWLYAVESAD